MRKKEERLLYTFHSTVHAIEMEKICKEEGHPGRLIPVPREITAGCGLAWSAPPEAEEELKKALKSHQLEPEGRYLLCI